MSLELEESEDLKMSENGIKSIYGSIRKVIGPTSASKTLHLICPNFFPMWDDNIRKEIGREMGKRSGLNCEADGYYSFMKEVKDFLHNYEDVLAPLQADIGKPKLRLIDEYLWSVANSSKKRK